MSGTKENFLFENLLPPLVTTWKKSEVAPEGTLKDAPVVVKDVKSETALPPKVIPSFLNPLKNPLAFTVSPATPDNGVNPLNIGSLNTEIA